MIVDINCDVGEGMNDEDVMPFISSANISCGAHAGNEHSIRRTIELALSYQVAIGAHPSFVDRPNFGRKEISVSSHELEKVISTQLEFFAGLVHSFGAIIHHVKPHGALYNMAAKNVSIAQTCCRVFKNFNIPLVFGLAGSELVKAANKMGLHGVDEVFADRIYQSDGQLVPRSNARAVIKQTSQVASQVLMMVERRMVQGADGSFVPLSFDTICFHGDNPNAAEVARTIHDLLKGHGFSIRPLSSKK